MGLDNFTTEGPRQRSKSVMEKKKKKERSIHKLKNSDPELSMVPGRYHIHEATCLEKSAGVEEDSELYMYICPECNKAALNFETVAKSDKLRFRDEDWADQAFDNIIESASSVHREDALDPRTEAAREEAGIKTTSGSSSGSSGDEDGSDDNPLSAFMS